MTPAGPLRLSTVGEALRVSRNQNTAALKSAERPPLLTVRTGHTGSLPPPGRGWGGIWACFPRDHPARWPATGQAPAQSRGASWRLPGCQLWLERPCRAAGGQRGGPLCGRSGPPRCLACPLCPVLSWEQRLRGVRPPVNRPPAGRGEGVAARQAGEPWQREAL